MNGSEPPDPEPRKYRHPLEAPPPAEDRETREERARDEALRQGRMVRVRFEGQFPSPYLTYLLLVVNVGIFLLRYVDEGLSDRLLNAGMLDPYSILQQGEWYRLVTAMFLHGSEAHILMNGISLYSLGSSVESMFGRRRFVLLYLLGGLMGSALHLLLGNFTPAVGASGAIFALVGAELLFLQRHHHFYGGAVRRQYQQLLLMVALNLGAGWFAAGIAIWGHVGGFIGGLWLAWFTGPQFVVPKGAVADEERTVTAIDARPLERNYTTVVIYSIVLVGLLIAAKLFLTP